MQQYGQGLSDDRASRTGGAVRAQDRRGWPGLHGQAGCGHRLPRPQRRGEVNDHAKAGPVPLCLALPGARIAQTSAKPVIRIMLARRGSAAAAVSAPPEPRRRAGRPISRRSWRAVFRRLLRPGDGIWLEPAGPVPGAVPGARTAGPLLAVAVTGVAAAQYATGRPLAPVAWLALLASVVLSPLLTAPLAGWTVLLGLGLALDGPGRGGRLAASLGVLLLLGGSRWPTPCCAAPRSGGSARPARRPGSRKARCCAKSPRPWPRPGWRPATCPRS